MYFLQQIQAQINLTIAYFNGAEGTSEIVDTHRNPNFDEQMQAMLSDGKINGEDQEAVLSLASMLNREQSEVIQERKDFMSDVTRDILSSGYTVNNDRDLGVLATMLGMADVDVGVLGEIPDELRTNMIFKKPRGGNNRLFTIHDSETGHQIAIVANSRFLRQRGDARSSDRDLGDNNVIDSDSISNFNDIFDIQNKPVIEPLIGSGGDDVIDAPADVVDAPADVVDAPADVVDAPADVVDAPADVVDAPADVVDAPADVVDAPADVVDAPADVVDAPADVVDAPADEITQLNNTIQLISWTQSGISEMYPDFQNPTKSQIIQGLNNLKDTRFNSSSQLPSSVQYAYSLQVAMAMVLDNNTLGNIDGMWGNNSSKNFTDLQNKLNTEGFDCGVADGKPGPNTIRALLNYLER